MNFNNVDLEWLKKWSDIHITKDSFITRHDFANICVRDVGIQPFCCIKEKLNKECSDCWGYVYEALHSGRGRII